MPKRLPFLRKINLMHQRIFINDRKLDNDSALNIRKVSFVQIGMFWLDFCTVRGSGLVNHLYVSMVHTERLCVV